MLSGTPPCVQRIVTGGIGCLAGLTSLDVSADSTVVITGSEDMTATISNLHTGKVLGTFQGIRHVLCQSDIFAFSVCAPWSKWQQLAAARHVLHVQHNLHFVFLLGRDRIILELGSGAGVSEIELCLKTIAVLLADVCVFSPQLHDKER